VLGLSAGAEDRRGFFARVHVAKNLQLLALSTHVSIFTCGNKRVFWYFL
jgi:hypothetical protein